MGGNLEEVLQWGICSVSHTSTVQFAGNLLWARLRLTLGVNSKVASPAFRDLSLGLAQGELDQNPKILALPLIFHPPNVYWHQPCARPWDAEQIHQSVLKSMAGRGNRHGAVDMQ